MMGHSHAILGALGWVAAAPVLAQHGWIEFDPAVYATGAVIASGAALLPDLDHPQATIARSLGPATEILSHGVAAVSGGHRKFTHTLWFVILIWVGMWALASWGGVLAWMAVTFLLAALAFQALKLAPENGLWGWLGITLEAGATTAAVYFFGPDNFAWLPWAVTAGVALHLVGDAMTPSGVPLLLGLTKWRLSVPVLPSTGGFVEKGLVAPAMGIAIGVLAFGQFTGSPYIGTEFNADNRITATIGGFTNQANSTVNFLLPTDVKKGNRGSR